MPHKTDIPNLDSIQSMGVCLSLLCCKLVQSSAWIQHRTSVLMLHLPLDHLVSTAAWYFRGRLGKGIRSWTNTAWILLIPLNIVSYCLQIRQTVTRRAVKMAILLLLPTAGIELKEGRNREEHVQRQRKLGCAHRP